MGKRMERKEERGRKREGEEEAREREEVKGRKKGHRIVDLFDTYSFSQNSA